MLEKPNKPFIYTCLGCHKNMYSLEEKATHKCEEKINLHEKRRLIAELDSLNKKKVIIEKRLFELKDQEKKLESTKNPKPKRAKRVKQTEKQKDGEINFPE